MTWAASGTALTRGSAHMTRSRLAIKFAARMRVIVFGGTGMVGQGVLRECLLAADVTEVLAIGRAPTGKADPKLRELVRADLLDYGDVEDQLDTYDACFFCFGVSSLGKKEAD